MIRVPGSYQPASWRYVTPVDDARAHIGVSFDLPDGSHVGYKLSIQDASSLHDRLAISLPSQPAQQSSDVWRVSVGDSRIEFARHVNGNLELFVRDLGVQWMLRRVEVSMLIKLLRALESNEPVDIGTLSSTQEDSEELLARMRAVPRWQSRCMFFPAVRYDEGDFARVYRLPVWLRYIRIAYVLSFRWLPWQIRDLLGCR